MHPLVRPVAVVLGAGALVAAGWFLPACGSARAGAIPQALDVRGRLVDLTYPFDSTTIYWPTAKPFTLTRAAWGQTDKGYFYASNDYAASEHGGTHVDAPIHFAEGKKTLGQIPLADYIGPAAKIDVTEACARDRDYLLTIDDVRAWEASHGRIPDGAWVVMHTGYDTEHWPDRTRILGTDKTGAAAVPELRFPGFGPETVTFLVEERSIRGIAIDTPSIDRGRSTHFEAHRVLNGADKPAVENIGHLDRLPASGATLFVCPMFIRDGSGGPARVFAILP